MNSLRRKIVGFVVASLVAVLGIYSILLYANFKEIIVANQEDHLSRLAIASCREMAQWFDAKKTEMLTLADSVSLAGKNKSIIGRRLKLHAATNPQYEMLFYADKQGNSFSSSDYQANIHDRPYFQQVLLTAAPVVSDPVVSRQSQRPIVVIAAPVKNGKRVTGVIGCTIPLAYLSQLTSHIKPSATGYAFVVQGDGTTIIHPDAKLAIKHNILKDPQIDPALLAAVSNMVRRQAGIAKYTYENVDKYLAYAPIPGSGWALAINAPVGEVLQQMSPINRLIVITPLFVVILASALISLLMIVLILRPLSALRNVMARVEAGDLNVWSDFVARDEIGQLVDSFNRMVQTLRQGTEKLRESEEKFRHLFERAEEGILIARGEALEFVNPALERILGHPMAMITSKTFIAFIHPDDQALVLDRHRRRMRGETLASGYDFRVVASDGTVKWITINSQVIVWEGASANLSFITDITDRKIVEGALKKSEERYRTILNEMEEGYQEVDLAGNFTFFNEAFLKVFGYSREEMMSTNYSRYAANEEIAQDVYRSYNQMFKTGIPIKRAEWDIVRKDGIRRTIEYYASPLRDSKNVITGFRGIARDVTERRWAENALRESRRQLSDIIDSLPDATFVIDMNRIVKAWNKEMESMTGIQAEEMIGKGNYEYAIPFYGERRPILIDLVLSQDSIYLMDKYDAVKKNGTTHSGEAFAPNLFGGKGAYLWGRASLLYNADGHIIGAIQAIRDITERKRAGEKRRELEDRLQRSEKMEALGTLAGGVAHDLNNMLGIIVGYSELLSSSIDESSPLQSKVATIMKGGERAAAVVQDLLTLARRGVQTRIAVNINSVVRNFLQAPEYEKILSYNPRMQVNADLQSGILNIMGSEIHLHKTIMNLVSNASEAMPGGGCLNIKTSNQYLDKAIRGYDYVREGEYVVLSISDTGEGISTGDIRHIFEPFYTKKVMGRSGTGLGLAVVWGTLKDHDGYIDVQSEQGKGTTFNLYFPVTREKISDDKISLPLSEYMGRGESILVVDDVKEQRDLASEMLSRLNYMVTTVSSGETAIEYLKANSVDILVLDMIMDPGMDGLDTYKEILKLYPKHKAIIVSGFSETDRVKEAHRLGAGAYVKKPYVIEWLGLAVRKELDRK